MAVLKICDSALVDGDAGASLFDDDDEDGEEAESQSSEGGDPTVSVCYHRCDVPTLYNDHTGFRRLQ